MKKLEYVYKYLVEGTREVMDDDDKVWFDYNFDKRCKYIEEQFIIKPETDLKGLSKFIGEVIDKLESSQKYHDEMNKPPKPEVTRIFNEDDYGFIISYLDSDLNIFECVECWQKAKKYVSYCIQGQEQQQDEPATPPELNTKKAKSNLTLPSELDTEEAREYFTKAIEAKYINVTNNGLQWVFGGNKGQIRLGYFCHTVYSTPRPINKLEEIFGVKKLSASISNAEIEAKRADVQKWRKEINDNIFNA